MTECDCLSEECLMVVYDKKPLSWADKWLSWSGKWPVYRNIITIHGKNLAELQERKNEIKKELELKYDNHVVKVY